MRKLLIIMAFASIFSSCKKEEEIVEFWDTLNCYMVVNNTTDQVTLRMNFPILTYKELHPRDTLKFLIQQSERQPGKAYNDPFNAADTCILTIKGKEYHYYKQDTSKGNPLFFDNYKVEKKTDMYFHLIFDIEEKNYDNK